MSSLFGRVSKSQQTLGVSNLCLFVLASVSCWEEKRGRLCWKNCNRALQMGKFAR